MLKGEGKSSVLRGSEKREEIFSETKMSWIYTYGLLRSITVDLSSRRHLTLNIIKIWWYKKTLLRISWLSMHKDLGATQSYDHKDGPNSRVSLRHRKVIHSEYCSIGILPHFQHHSWHRNGTIETKEFFSLLATITCFLSTKWKEEGIFPTLFVYLAIGSCFKVFWCFFTLRYLKETWGQKSATWGILNFLPEVLRKGETIKLHNDIKKKENKQTKILSWSK